MVTPSLVPKTDPVIAPQNKQAHLKAESLNNSFVYTNSAYKLSTYREQYREDASVVSSALSDHARKRSRLQKLMAAGNLDLQSLENEDQDTVTMFMRAKIFEKDQMYEEAIEAY